MDDWNIFLLSLLSVLKTEFSFLVFWLHCKFKVLLLDFLKFLFTFMLELSIINLVLEILEDQLYLLDLRSVPGSFFVVFFGEFWNIEKHSEVVLEDVLGLVVVC